MVNLTKYRKFLLLICIDRFYYNNWVVSTLSIWLILPKTLVNLTKRIRLIKLNFPLTNNK